MADRFYNPVEVPVIEAVPPVEPGFARIYGRGSDAYALFDDGTEKLLTGAGGVIVVGNGERDVSFPDTFRLAEALAGVIGPVQTSDSADLTTALVARDLFLADSIDASDDLGPISGLSVADSTDVADRLSGVIGPIIAPDTLDATDDPVIGPATVTDSIETDDAANVGVLTAIAADTLRMLDILSEIITFKNESFGVADVFPHIRLSPDDSAAVLDAFGLMATRLGDGYLVVPAANAALQSDQRDSWDATDRAHFGPVSVGEAGDLADLRGLASVTGVVWANQVVTQSGMTTPANLTDLNEATGASISITQSGGFLGGSSETANGNITVALPDPVLSPTPTILSAQLQWGWTTTSSGGLQNGNSVNAVIEYSVNDGASWANLETVTNDAGTGNNTLNITGTYTQLQQIRFRATITVTSGTTALVGGANQTFSFRYARCAFSLEQAP